MAFGHTGILENESFFCELRHDFPEATIIINYKRPIKKYDISD